MYNLWWFCSLWVPLLSLEDVLSGTTATCLTELHMVITPTRSFKFGADTEYLIGNLWWHLWRRMIVTFYHYSLLYYPRSAGIVAHGCIPSRSQIALSSFLPVLSTSHFSFIPLSCSQWNFSISHKLSVTVTHPGVRRVPPGIIGNALRRGILLLLLLTILFCFVTNSCISVWKNRFLFPPQLSTLIYLWRLLSWFSSKSNVTSKYHKKDERRNTETWREQRKATRWIDTSWSIPYRQRQKSSVTGITPSWFGVSQWQSISCSWFWARVRVGSLSEPGVQSR